MKVFGPIPSRRLGQSLGINNIPPKICSYACSYCQVGKSMKMTMERSSFYNPEELAETVKKKVISAATFNEKIDYLTFVPDGEPTLDIHLSKEIELLKPNGIKIAVITNGSLLWNEDVRYDLRNTDLVSVKIDALDEKTWRTINHPFREIHFDEMLKGILKFRESYPWKLITETMLVKGVNDHADHIQKVADFLSLVNPDTAYLAIPIRPPSNKKVKAPDESIINNGFQIISSRIQNVEYLVGYEGNAFAFTGNVKDDILSITAVHPMREDAIEELMKKGHANKNILEDLLDTGEIVETTFENRKFYVRKLHNGIEV
jgi:wyosine [tRNA(Phe)-imidazoG37] synthetase (radical SAM superfamily)